MVVAGSMIGCIEPFDPPSNLTDSFLVLALRAEPRAVHPDESVVVTALEYQAPGAPADPEQLWIVCLPAEGEGPQACLGAALGDMMAGLGRCRQLCEADPDPPRCQEQCSQDAFAHMLCSSDGDARGCIAGYGPEGRYHVPIDFDQDRFFAYLLAASDPDGLEGCMNQWAEQIMDSGVAAPTETCTISFRRIEVLGPDAPATDNPEIVSVTVGGRAVSSNSVTLQPTDIAEGKLAVRVESDAPADSYMSWFSDCGEFEHSRTFGPEGTNRLTIDKSGTCSLFAVVRDTSYGVAWAHLIMDTSGLAADD